MSSSDALFPLDISYSEISQWLANRRQLSNDWIKRLKAVQTRSAKAYASLPGAFASQFEATEEGVAEYLIAKKIRDRLAETTERGYFGGLSGEAGVWDKIVKSYESGNLFLGEAGQRIVQTVDYDVPFLKKRMEALDKRTQELGRKKSDCANNAISSASVFLKECKELGIPGQELKHEIIDIGERIYDYVQKGFEALESEKTKAAVQFYRVLNARLHGTGEKALPIVQSVFDGTVEAPSPHLVKHVHPLDDNSDQEPALSQAMAEKVEEIDFDISWDIAVGEVTEDDSKEPAETQITWEDEGNDINWDIELEQTEETADVSNTVLNEGNGDNPATPNAAQSSSVEVSSSPVLRFVWDATFRNALLNDLCELHAFLVVRRTADMTDAVSLTLADILHKVDASQIELYYCHISECISLFTGEVSQRYLMLKTSPNYAERLLADLQKKQRREQEWKELALQSDQERRSAQTELSQVAIKVGHLARQTKELKQLVEDSISPLFDNRQINIMGRINAVISNS